MIDTKFGTIGVITGPSIPEDVIYIVGGKNAYGMAGEALRDCRRDGGRVHWKEAANRFADIVRQRARMTIWNVRLPEDQDG